MASRRPLLQTPHHQLHPAYTPWRPLQHADPPQAASAVAPLPLKFHEYTRYTILKLVLAQVYRYILFLRAELRYRIAPNMRPSVRASPGGGYESGGTGTPSTVTTARPPQVLPAVMFTAFASTSSPAEASASRHSPSMIASAAACTGAPSEWKPCDIKCVRPGRDAPRHTFAPAQRIACVAAEHWEAVQVQ